MRGATNVQRSGGRARLVALVFAWIGVLLLLTGSDRDQRLILAGHDPGDHVYPVTVPTPMAGPLGRRASLITLTVLTLLALLVWINAAVDPYRFNIAIAVLGTVPIALAAIRARVIRTASMS